MVVAEAALVAAVQAEAGNMKKLLIHIIFSVFFAFNSSGQDEKNKIKIVFAGDIMGHDSQIAAAKNGNSYDYDTCFALIQPYLQNADIAVANLEVTLAGPPYKGYPQFSSPDELASAVKKAGFDIMITANNHSLDRRKKGLERTIDVLDEMSIIRTGTFKSPRERKKYYPLIIEKNNFRLALLNYTYGTNGIRVEEPNIVNYIDRDQIAADLQKAKSAEPDYIIVTMHWGLEYQRTENIDQRELAEFLKEKGADAIIGSHPHVVQPVKLSNDQSLVVYSLGNFISNQRKRYTDGGILFEMTLEKIENVKISEIKYLPVWVYKPSRPDGGNHFVLIPSNKDKEYYEKLNMNEADFQKMKIFNDDTSTHLSGIDQVR